MMPHPERAMEFTSLYDWPRRKEAMRRKGVPVPQESLNMQIFRNITAYFRDG
jgi:phosphoribosylformylglycinamidine synthase